AQETPRWRVDGGAESREQGDCPSADRGRACDSADQGLSSPTRRLPTCSGPLSDDRLGRRRADSIQPDRRISAPQGRSVPAIRQAGRSLSLLDFVGSSIARYQLSTRIAVEL